jgi:hypothetical protein
VFPLFVVRQVLPELEIWQVTHYLSLSEQYLTCSTVVKGESVQDLKILMELSKVVIVRLAAALDAAGAVAAGAGMIPPTDRDEDLDKMAPTAEDIVPAASADADNTAVFLRTLAGQQDACAADTRAN